VRLSLLLLWPLLTACAQQIPVREYGYQVVRVYPHDPSSFTQGLEYRDGVLYEGTGNHGQSKVRKVTLDNGQVLLERDIDAVHFGEGVTVLRNKLFQITWQTQTGFIYDRATFKPLGTFRYKGEGWGLTNDGQRLYMSDGTADIRVWEGEDLREVRRIRVRDGGREVRNINELEWVKGEIYANIWMTDRIARISPVDGRVLGWIDLSGLLTERERQNGADVLNGIAYDAARDRLFVTGKWWPKLFEIKLVPRKPLR